MKNLTPWRFYIGIIAIALIGISFLVDIKIAQPVKEVTISNLEVASNEEGPVVSFDLINKSDRLQSIDEMEVDLSSLVGASLDKVEVNESIVIEPGKKRRIEMAWVEAVGAKGWLWTNIKLEDTKAHQQLSWFWPSFDLTNPVSLFAFSPVVFWFVVRKSFFT